jgi:site-specific DNA-methyltransferase (adenine-specific)
VIGILHIVVARKPIEGTIVENCCKFGCGALNIDGCRIETKDNLNGGATNSDKGVVAISGFDRPWMHDKESLIRHQEKMRQNVAKAETLGRFPANLILNQSEEIIREFPEAKGWSSQRHNSFNPYGGHALNKSATQREGKYEGFNDSGSAARFFFNYSEQESDE